jgi:redox-sensitive bicupin YhaK (pirin superfamily)
MTACFFLAIYMIYHLLTCNLWESIMIQLRKSGDRGHADHGWLNTYHTFSFADYQDPSHMGFRSLRVINEDRVQSGMGFGTHGHRDMEIISYVLEGALEHKDSMGNGEVLRPGEFQRMSAGAGVRHSEFNPSVTEPVHFYQIWLLPQSKGIQPSYEQKFFTEDEKRGKLRIVASPDGAEGSLTIHQDAKVYLSTLNPGESVKHTMLAGRHAWLQVLRGSVSVNGTLLETSDGLAVSDERSLTIVGERSAEAMLFDLA